MTAPVHPERVGQLPSERPAAADLRGPQAGAGTAEARIRQWLMLTACYLLLTALAFDTRPGNVISDTKIDMPVNPIGFLSRALHIWDPAQFGQLQNQAAGYFFPMGPFFVLGKLSALPAWVVQRLWLAALLIAAFAGVVKLAARLRIGNAGSQMVAGFAYALSPLGLSLLGVNSSEYLPAAMLPWIMIPLVRLVREPSVSSGQHIQAVARSALAVALCSGINATSVLAVLTPAAIYVLTAGRGLRVAVRILGYWIPAVILACLWWVVPLELFGHYGSPLLHYTETAQITTSFTSLPNILRGTEDWVTHAAINGQPWSPVGFHLATGTVPALLTGLIAGLGLTGLLDRRLRDRRFLLTSLVAGVIIIGTGYVSGLGNPLAAFIDQIINGPLAPLRNLHKFDAMIRLPVALGLCNLLAVASAGWRRRLVSIAAVAGIAGIAVPAATTGLAAGGSFPALPSYWVAASTWLNRHAGNRAVLAVPGAPFGEYFWGRPMDDVLEATFTGDWAAQQLATVGSPGSTRMLIAIDQRLAAGEGSAGLTQVLARLGVKYIVVRNDLIYPDLTEEWPARIHDALYSSPGIVKVAQFGAYPVGSATPDDAVSNFLAFYPPVEIFQVKGVLPVATVVPAASAIRVYGAPESVLTLADLGLLKQHPVLLNADMPKLPAAGYMITDSLRRRIRNFGEVGYGYSATLTAHDPATTYWAAKDFLGSGWARYLAVARYSGIANVTGSTSSADIGALPGQSATGRLPFAAVDGNLATMWESGSTTGPLGQWLRIQFSRPVFLRQVAVAFADDQAVGPPVTRVTVTSATGQVVDVVRPVGSTQVLRAPAGSTTWLRITIDSVAGQPLPGEQAGIAEVLVPGVTPRRMIVAPVVSVPGSAPVGYVLGKAEPLTSGCMLTSLGWVCASGLVKPTEEQYGFDHLFTAAASSRAGVSGLAVLSDSALVRRYAFSAKSDPRVSASSVYTPDPQDQATSAFDGNIATPWIAGPNDRHPVLRIQWRGMRTLNGILIVRPPAASSLAQVLVTGSGGQLRGGVLGYSGWLSFARPLRTDRLVIAITPTQLPLQVSEVEIPGVRPLLVTSRRISLPCGFGPTITMNGQPVRTRATGTVADIAQGRAIRFAACGPVTVQAGTNQVVEPAADPRGFDVQSMAIDPVAAAGLPNVPKAQVTAATVVSWGVAHRVLRVDAGQRSFLILAENFNIGWRATVNGRVLIPVRLDGWMQGWLLPAGTHGLVILDYRPDHIYRASVFAGLGLVGLIIVLSFVPLRSRRNREQSGGSPPVEEQPVRRPRGRILTWSRPVFGLTGSVLAGLWLAGIPGAVAAPAAALLFAAALRRAAMEPGRIASAMIAHPLVPLLLLLAVSASIAVGDGVGLGGTGGSLAAALLGAGPQIACLVVVVRLGVELFSPSA